MNTMTTIHRFRTLIACGLLGAVVCSLPVLPAVADSSGAPQMTVKYGDLNISNPHGAATLYARIRAAADSVCSTFAGRRIEEKIRRDACLNNAISGAVTTVNSPALSAVYSAKTGKELPARLASLSK